MYSRSEERRVGKECWTFMVLLMQTGLEIWTKEDVQVGMCLAYLEVHSVR